VAIAELPGLVASDAPLPMGATELSRDNMPRLAQAVSTIVSALGVPGMAAVLDLEGPVRVYLSQTTLVIGAGALSVIGASELPFAIALALRIGDGGAQLGAVEEPPGLGQAVADAFAAYPATQAACRVLAYYAANVRGLDPATADLGALVGTAPGFGAIAGAVLAGVA
jgi:hypothetical protein